MRRQFGKNDIIFIGALLFICLVILAAYYFFFHDQGSYVVVTVDGKEYGTYMLSQEQTVTICDDSGEVTNTLEISGGKADMTEADCPDKLCVHQKAISLEKENIVCLPNRVVVTVEGTGTKDDDVIDGFAQ
jgi:hypothetical protein